MAAVVAAGLSCALWPIWWDELEVAVFSMGQTPPLLTRATLQPPTSTLYIASTTISVPLRMGTKADPVCKEKQEKPITSHTKLTGKIGTMPQAGSPWFPMKQELCILSEYNQAAVALSWA